MLELTSPGLIFARKTVIKTPTGLENAPNAAGIQGNDAAQTVILFNNEADELLKGDERTQLMKIVAACKLKEENVLLVNAAYAKGVSVDWLRKKYPVSKLIVFGDFEISRNLKLKKHWAYTIDGLQIVKTEPINRLFKSDADKKALWMELKKMYGV